MDNNFDTVKDHLLPIDEINRNILSRYNMKNAKITSIKFKDTDKQRAVYRIDFNNNSYCEINDEFLEFINKEARKHSIIPSGSLDNHGKNLFLTE